MAAGKLELVSRAKPRRRRRTTFQLTRRPMSVNQKIDRAIRRHSEQKYTQNTMYQTAAFSPPAFNGTLVAKQVDITPQIAGTGGTAQFNARHANKIHMESIVFSYNVRDITVPLNALNPILCRVIIYQAPELIGDPLLVIRGNSPTKSMFMTPSRRILRVISDRYHKIEGFNMWESYLNRQKKKIPRNIGFESVTDADPNYSYGAVLFATTSVASADTVQLSLNVEFQYRDL